MRVVLLAYVALLLYGSWHPFQLAPPRQPLLSFLQAGLPAHLDKGDVLQNVLVYMPFGLLFVCWRSGRRPNYWSALALAASAATLLSLAVELVQQYLPSRVASPVDVLTNCGGAVLGGLLALCVSRHTLTGAAILGWRDAWFRSGPLANTGLLALALWVLSQTSPLVPSFDIGHLRRGAGMLLRQLMDPAAASAVQLGVAAGYLTAVGLLLRTLERAGRRAMLAPLLLIGFVLACKMLVVGRQLSLEMLAGAALALLALPPLCRLPPRAAAAAGIALLAGALVLSESAPAPWSLRFAFNWVPFLGQMSGLGGFGNILEFLWPCMAMAVLARYAAPYRWHAACAAGGALAVGLGLFALEWRQQWLGRVGDITQVLLACAGWLAPWCVRGHDAAAADTLLDR